MAAAGKIIPAIKSRPLPDDDTAPYLDAYYALHGSRHYVEGIPLPIPMTEIAAYLEINEVLDIDDRLDYIRFIQTCDAEFRERVKKPSDGTDIRRQRQPQRGSRGSSGR